MTASQRLEVGPCNERLLYVLARIRLRLSLSLSLSPPIYLFYMKHEGRTWRNRHQHAGLYLSLFIIPCRRSDTGICHGLPFVFGLLALFLLADLPSICGAAYTSTLFQRTACCSGTLCAFSRRSKYATCAKGPTMRLFWACSADVPQTRTPSQPLS